MREKQRKRPSNTVRRKEKQSNVRKSHCKICCEKWPRFWTIWVNMLNLSAHTSTLKKNCRSTLFMIRVHPKNCVTRRKKKRITLPMMKVYPERKMMKIKKRNNMFQVRMHWNNFMKKRGGRRSYPGDGKTI